MKRLLVVGVLAVLMVGCASTQSKKTMSVADGDAMLKRVMEADLSAGLVVQNMELTTK